MKVGEFCNHQVVVGEATDSLLNAARRMRRLNTEYLIVIEKNGDYVTPKGILTGRDIINQSFLEDIDPNTMTLADMMLSEPVIAREDDEIDSTLSIMSKIGIRYIPVVNNMGLLTGIFTIDNYINALSEEVNRLRALVNRGETHSENTRLI